MGEEKEKTYTITRKYKLAEGAICKPCAFNYGDCFSIMLNGKPAQVLCGGGNHFIEVDGKD